MAVSDVERERSSSVREREDARARGRGRRSREFAAQARMSAVSFVEKSEGEEREAWFRANERTRAMEDESSRLSRATARDVGRLTARE